MSRWRLRFFVDLPIPADSTSYFFLKAAVVSDGSCAYVPELQVIPKGASGAYTQATRSWCILGFDSWGDGQLERQCHIPLSDEIFLEHAARAMTKTKPRHARTSAPGFYLPGFSIPG